MNTKEYAPLPRPDEMDVGLDYIKVSYEVSDSLWPMIDRYMKSRADILAIGMYPPGGYVIRNIPKGYSVGSFRIVRLGDRIIETASGESARYWKPPVGYKISWGRVDVAVDFIYNSTGNYDRDFRICEDLIKDVYLYYMGVHETKRKNMTVTLVTGTNGSTVYVGKRSSERFLRIYNKTAETQLNKAEEIAPTVRVELELKGRAILFHSPYLPPDEQFVSKVVSLMSNHYFVPHLNCEIRRERIGTPMKRDKDIEKKLKWIREKVLNTIRELSLIVPEELEKMGIVYHDKHKDLTGYE